MKFWLASIKTLIFEILTEIPCKIVVEAFRKPPVILKSNYLNFPSSLPASGTFYRITGGFLNAAATECKFYCSFG
jgi:hypothetical protein